MRLYDPIKQTLHQQNIEADGIYRIELQETEPGKRWSQPKQDVVEHLPQWVWRTIAMLLLLLIVLMGYFSRCFRTMFGVPPTQFSEESA